MAVTENALTWGWWAAAGVLLVAELLTGTFYLLMIAIGLAAAGVAHLLGAAVSVQMTTAAVLALLLLALLHRYRLSRQRTKASLASTDNAGALWRASATEGDADSVARSSSWFGKAAAAGASQLLDIGAEVDVPRWDAGNRTRVRYRGTDWHAIGDPPPAVLMAGRYRIIGMDGIRLVLRAVDAPEPAARVEPD
jgi:membrane protein implicated in regulation of membrane protease activity